VDCSARVHNRTVVSLLDWSRGDRLLITVVGTSAVIQRRPDGVLTMTAKPYVVPPAVVRARCGIGTGQRILLAADPAHNVLAIHPAAVVEELLGDLHTRLAEEGSR
jgi:bifunctional DNA-binding transcriptional regulator/antitoxin component of YhaV-PrlF toxin-antitoxin module